MKTNPMKNIQIKESDSESMKKSKEEYIERVKSEFEKICISARKALLEVKYYASEKEIDFSSNFSYESDNILSELNAKLGMNEEICTKARTAYDSVNDLYLTLINAGFPYGFEPVYALGFMSRDLLQ
jgi:hypothetical protein